MYVRLKTYEDFTEIFDVIVEGDLMYKRYSHFTKPGKAFPRDCEYLLGEVITVTQREGIYRFQTPSTGGITIFPEMIDEFITKNKNPEYFL